MALMPVSPRRIETETCSVEKFVVAEGGGGIRGWSDVPSAGGRRLRQEVLEAANEDVGGW